MDQASEMAPDEEHQQPIAEDDCAPEVADELGRLERIIESVLFASAAPLSLRRLTEILEGPTTKEVYSAVARLLRAYGPGQRGIQLHEVAGGYQFRTAREHAEWVRAVFRDKPARLGRAALETLAIVAYKQPVTRADIEAIRGVDVDAVLSGLLARRLVKIVGRRETVGRPLLYATTPEFLEAFGLKDLSELPSLKELGPPPDAEDADSVPATEAETRAEGIITPGGVEAPGAIECTATDSPTTSAETADGAPAEDSQPGRDRLTAQSGGDYPGGTGAPERPSGDTAGDESEPRDRSDHD
jgi:segregation and condensation protein B